MNMIFSMNWSIGQGSSSDYISIAYMEDQKYSKGSVNAGTPFPKPLDNVVV